MTQDSGRDPLGQALVASDGAATHLHPSGFDPSRLPEVLEGHWSTGEGRTMAESYLGKPRAELCHGEMTDLELANAIFMVDRYDLKLIGFQEAAKQRIRWLSAQLAIAMEARQRLDRADGLDPKGESAAPQEDAR